MQESSEKEGVHTLLKIENTIMLDLIVMLRQIECSWILLIYLVKLLSTVIFLAASKKHNLRLISHSVTLIDSIPMIDLYLKENKKLLECHPGDS